MSLDSHGSTFKMVLPVVDGTDLKTGMNVTHPSTTFITFAKDNSLEAKKEAFKKMMAEFAESKHFESYFYPLYSKESLLISHSVNTVRPL